MSSPTSQSFDTSHTLDEERESVYIADGTLALGFIAPPLVDTQRQHPSVLDPDLTDKLRAFVHRLVKNEMDKLEGQVEATRKTVQGELSDTVEMLEHRCADRFTRNGKSIDAVMTGIDKSDELNQSRFAAIEDSVASFRRKLELVVSDLGVQAELNIHDSEAPTTPAPSTITNGEGYPGAQTTYNHSQVDLASLWSIVAELAERQGEDRTAFSEEIVGLSRDMARLFERFQEFETSLPPTPSPDNSEGIGARMTSANEDLLSTANDVAGVPQSVLDVAGARTLTAPSPAMSQHTARLDSVLPSVTVTPVRPFLPFPPSLLIVQ
ncbi:unnamed protein product [Peniophora sp. CBMAI 1063]|nr:unnamed protein product [Peniophora sp. CBMAI 1063]